MNITYYGHSCFSVEVNGKQLLFDPFITPNELARRAGNKYLSVLVAAKFARFVNDFPRDQSVDLEKKLTTRALEELSAGGLTYKLIRRRRQET